MAQPLVKRLELPLPDALTTKVLGIHQGDLILKSALDVAMADLRANPSLLNFIWASLPQDPLTWKEYGMKEVNQCKKWFLDTNIPVKISPIRSEMVLPCIVITMADSSEATNESTLGDVNPETAFETTYGEWPALTRPLTPASYEPLTGIVTLRSKDVPDDILISEGMFIVDKVGTPYEILQVYDATSFKIAPATVADFKGAVLKGHRPAWVTSIESSSFKETYQVSVNVGGEPTLTVLLHSVVVFCLLRYKQALLESRGFERSTFSSSDLRINQSFPDTEAVFTRNITVSGCVRMYWPKIIAPAIDGIVSQERVSGSNRLPVGMNPDDQLWVGECDSLSQNR
jgi:hypothetical protein